MGLFVSALLCFVAILVDLQPTRFGVRMTFGSDFGAKLVRIIYAAR